MNDFESAVARCHTEFVKAGHSWAQPRAISMTELADAERGPNAWISPPTERPLKEQRLVFLPDAVIQCERDELFGTQAMLRAFRDPLEWRTHC